MWEKKCIAEDKRKKKESLLKDRESKKKSAINRTKEANDAINQLQNILKTTLTIDDKIDWENLKDNSSYNVQHPKKPKYKTLPIEPKETDSAFIREIGFIGKIFKTKKDNKIETAKQKFTNAHKNYLEEKEKIEKIRHQLVNKI